MDRLVVSFYKFVKIDNPHELKELLLSRSLDLGLQGTILVSLEGINAMISGEIASMKAFERWFKGDLRFADVEFKESLYAGVSFRRMLVKVKKEIITMRQQVDPVDDTGAYVSPLEFKDWQDSNKDMIIVDTRNDYEVALGSFKNALNPNIKTFGEYPEWVSEHLNDDQDKEKVVVTFCTGGIRCEKATAYMKQQGFKNVYQLEGGIIKYFEETNKVGGENHWDGECVVFDKRLAIDKNLKATQKEICYVCLCELGDANRSQKEYPAGKACVSCDKKMTKHQDLRNKKGLEKHKKNLKQREVFLKAQRQKFEKFSSNSSN